MSSAAHGVRHGEEVAKALGSPKLHARGSSARTHLERRYKEKHEDGAGEEVDFDQINHRHVRIDRVVAQQQAASVGTYAIDERGRRADVAKRKASVSSSSSPITSSIL